MRGLRVSHAAAGLVGQRAEGRSQQAPALADLPLTTTTDPHPVVYYVRLGDHIKIGTTSNLTARLNSLYVDHDPDLLLAVEPGGRDLESQRHSEFAAERVYANRELFNPSPRLLSHITAIRRRGEGCTPH